MSVRCKTALFAAAAVMFASCVWGLNASGAYRHGSFKAFYCAGQAVAGRSDPYRVQPLRSCERAAVGTLLDADEVEPAPLPGYVLAGFAGLSRLPFSTAAIVFSCAAALAAIAAALLLASLVDVSAALVMLILVPLSLLNIAYSELPVFSMAALVLSGWAIRNRKWTLAGIAGGLTVIQPHIAAAVVISLFVLAPRTRIALLCTLAVLAAVSVAALGPATNVEYLRALPVQALSELSASDQYSLSHLLYSAGVSAKASVLAGQVNLAFMIVAGLIGAHVARKRLNAPEMIVFFPACAVLFGGLYLHDIQFIVALPAAIVAAARTDGARAIACWLSLTALAIVWTQRASVSVAVLNTAAAAAVALAFLHGPLILRAVRGLAIAAAACAALLVLHPRVPAAAPHAAFSLAPNELAATAWADYIRSDPQRSTESLRNIASKIPSWLGIAALLVAVPLRRRLAGDGDDRVRIGERREDVILPSAGEIQVSFGRPFDPEP